MRALRLAALAACIFAALPAQARITEINVQKVEPFANGATFGNAGAYERVWGVAKGELCDRDGSYAPLATTKKEREAKGDPRPSLEERYGSHSNYVKKVEASARALVRDRLLLAEDAERFVSAAREDSVVKLFAR